jgi:hypothetical protein
MSEPCVIPHKPYANMAHDLPATCAGFGALAQPARASARPRTAMRWKAIMFTCRSPLRIQDSERTRGDAVT